MIARAGFAAAALLLLGGSADDPFTLATAYRLPNVALEERVLQMSRASTGEVQIYSRMISPMMYAWPDVAFQISFADKPDTTGFPGLCASDVLTADFGPYSPEFTAQTPVRLLRTANTRRFAISVDDLLNDRPPSQATCVALGSVLSSRVGSRFFEGESDAGRPLDARDATTALSSVHNVIRDALSDTLTLNCEEDVLADLVKGLIPLCPDPKPLLAKLRWETLFHLSYDRCEDGVACVLAILDRPDAPLMALHFEIRVRQEDRGILSATVHGVTHVD